MHALFDRHFCLPLDWVLEGIIINVLPIIVLIAAFVPFDSHACKKVGERPRVTAMDEGIFYARSIPAEDSKGKTTIYLVGMDNDKIVDSYDWYNQHTIVLAWSPIVGEVAVLKYNPEDEMAALSFYIGGQHLKSYSHNDLKPLGVTPLVNYCGVGLDLKIIGQEQVPGTNEYVFKINFLSTGIKSFNITTGLQVIEK